jgi:EAL domain-containing protein (putative c-di-GMP-specific phosphodiesterase class I)
VRIARFGGDEFVVFLSEFASENFVHKVAHRVMRVLAEPFELSTRVSGVSTSVGLALVPGDARTFAELLRAADAAMYHAKRLGGNCIERYTPELDAHVQCQAGLERDLREALRRDEFELHYQPQHDCRTLKVSSAEALIRWRHPTRGLVSPCEFIPLAERSNLICEIGDWVIREATVTIARLEQLGMALRISVNVSPQQLEQPEFVGLVKAALARSHANPRLLEVEITESCAMRDCKSAAERLGRLADIGVSVAIDDFGTGYSNLASLIRLPVSRLKIDRSLLQDLTSRAEVQTLAQTIISMAGSLGFHCVAEGVEDADQLKLLCDLGCDVVQGFFLSRPIEQAALEQLLLRNAMYPHLASVAC